jgi:hypothetical protein
MYAAEVDTNRHLVLVAVAAFESVLRQSAGGSLLFDDGD